MNARAYSYYPVTIYTLTNPTDKYGKLVRVKDNEYCLTDLGERVKPVDTPNVWNSCDSPVPIRVEFNDLCVFLGNVEKVILWNLGSNWALNQKSFLRIFYSIALLASCWHIELLM